jgi:hypothetical protein
MPVSSGPLPVAFKVRPVKVTFWALGLLTEISKTPTFAAPGCWVLLEGELEPIKTVSVGGAGVSVTVGVKDKVKVGVRSEEVGVEDGVVEAVGVDVGVGVLVGVAKGVDVFETVGVGVPEGVWVGVSAGD